MILPVLAAFLSLTGVLQAPQAQAPAQPGTPAQPAAERDKSAPASPDSYKSDLGFSFLYPADWQVMDAKPIMPAVRLQEEEKATSDPEKRGAACTQIGFLIRHGDPASVILSVALPYDCFGSKFAASDLPGIGAGVSQGMARSFEMKDPVYGAFKSGSHDLWIERANGWPKEHPDDPYTVETVCGLLDKGIICFMGIMKGDASLKTFEKAQITLESDAVTDLVHADAFPEAKK